MFKFLLNNLKNILLFSLITGALYLLGNTINNLIKWEYLTMFFKVIKTSLLLFDFTLDITTLNMLLGLGLLALMAYWGFKATWAVINFFK